MQLREEHKIVDKDKKVFMKLFHEAPLNIVIVFLTMISAFYLSSILAKRKLKKICINQQIEEQKFSEQEIIQRIDDQAKTQHSKNAIFFFFVLCAIFSSSLGVSSFSLE